MMTTVTVGNELRVRLKRLAAKYDTTQAEIIKRAVDLFEKDELASKSRLGGLKKFPSVDAAQELELNEMLAVAREKFEADHPEVVRVHESLRARPSLLEEVMVSAWTFTSEEE